MRYSLSLLVLLVAAVSSGADPAEQIQQTLAGAKAAAEKRQFETADRLSVAAEASALQNNLPDLATEAAVLRTETLQKWIATPNVSAADRQFACNNLGVHLLRQNKADKAIEAFEQVKEPKGVDAYVYLANYARALEKGKRFVDALRVYQASLNTEPRFSLAAERAAALLAAEGPKLTPEERRRAAQGLLGTSGLPTPRLRAATVTLLTAWKADPAAEDVLPFVVRYLADTNMTSERFARDEAKQFDTWQTSDRLRDRLDELRKVFEATGVGPARDFAPGVELLRSSISKTLPAWAPTLPSVTGDFARVLASAADDFARRARTGKGDAERKALARQAVQRFALAASIVRDDTTDRLAAVGVVAEHRPLLDPEWKAIDGYIRDLFEAKSSIYLSDRLTEADLRSLGSFHITLAGILETRGDRWGEAEHRAMSVEFQLKKAIWVEQQLRRPGVATDYPVSPDLRRRLAVACLKTGEKDRAAECFRDSADLYLTLGAAAQADQVLSQYRMLRAENKLPAPPDPARLARLEELVKAAATGRPATELATARPPVAVAFLSADLVGVGADKQLVGWKVNGKEVSSAPWTGTLLAAAPKTGDFVCSAGDDDTSSRIIDSWTSKGGKVGHPWQVAVHTSPVRALAISADGRVTASVDAKGGLRVFRTTNGRLVLDGGPFADSRAVAFRKPGEVVVAGKAGNGKGAVALVPLGGGKNGKPVWTAEHPVAATAVASSDDERLVAAGFEDGTVAVFDATNGKLVKSFGAHPGAVRSVAFVPGDSRLLGTLGSDQAARFWLAADGHEVARFGNPRPPVGLSFSPDGRLLALALDEFAGGRVRIWEVPKVPVK